MPSKALIDALGWDVMVEIDKYLEDAAEEIRAERRRLLAAQHEVLVRPGREADMLWRLGDVEYALRDELSRATQRLRSEIQELKDEIRRLKPQLPPGEALKT
ncbi:MAG: hypothetical protein HY560_07430 [Gemmatimonadetes bacterium]|nr:hypothetical protein [Gemmatimonadota bacterium]